METTDKHMKIHLYGAGGHAKVVTEVVESCGWEVVSFIDDSGNSTELFDIPVYRQGDISDNLPVLVSVGDNRARRSVVEKIRYKHPSAPAAVASSSIVSRRAEIGEGSVVMQGAIVQACAKVGRHVIINTGATVDHDCVIGDFAHISPNATLCGNVHVGEGTQIGAGAVVVPGIRIGKWSLVQAGSVVTTDIPDNVVAGGNRCVVIRKINME